MIKNEYNYNANFKRYVDEFCRNNSCTVEEALENDQVKRMFWRYTEV